MLIALSIGAAPGQLSVRAQTPAYNTGFESAASFSTGNLHNQNNWVVAQGSASVVTTPVLSGDQAVALSPNSPLTTVQRAFTEFSSQSIVHVDFHTRPTAATEVTYSTLFDTEAGRAAFVLNGTQGEVYAFDGNGLGGGSWINTGLLLPVDENGNATNWIRFTFRQNYAAKRWDLYLNGTLVWADLGFRDDSKTAFALFNAQAALEAAVGLDDFLVSSVNPLFTDEDNDGMGDGWEVAHGLNPAAVDRDADPDGDGLKNIDEYRRGTNPAAADSDSDGLSDSAEIYLGSNPLVADNYQTSLSVTGARLHLRADAGLIIDGSGYLSQWQDTSGNSNHGTQATVGSQPRVVANQLNGRPVVRFDGNDMLALPNFMGAATAGDAFIVLKTATSTPGTAYGLWRMSTYGSTNHTYYPADDGRIYEDFGSAAVRPNFAPTATPLDLFQIYNVTAASNSWAARFNGTVQAQFSTNTVGFHSSPLLGSNGGYYLTGDIAEVVIFDRTLTASEREAMGTYLAQKYALTITVPSTPANLAAVPMSTTQMSLTWSGATGGGAATYSLERQSGAGAFQAVANLTADQSYVDSGLSPGTQYSYRVLARSYSGASDFSTVVTATTFAVMAEFPTSGMRLWLKADAGIQSGSEVGFWLDQSGHGMHASQPAENQRLHLVTNALNGRPVLHFDGVNDYLILPNFMSGATAGDMFVVLKASTTRPKQAAPWSFGTGSGALYPHLDGHIYDEFGATLQRDVTAVDEATITSYRLYNATSVADRWTGRLDSLERRVYLTNPVSFRTDPVMGRMANFPEFHFAGDLAEMIVFDRELGLSERVAVGRYLAKKYDLNIAPYRLAQDDPDGDADNDGLTNRQEITLYATDPLVADTDHDGIPDPAELQIGTNPLVADGQLDPDNDGLANFEEYLLGTNRGVPGTPDTNGILQLRLYRPRP